MSDYVGEVIHFGANFMVQIELPPNVFNRLQKLAIPLVDTLDSVLTRVLDAYEQNGHAPKAAAPSAGTSVQNTYSPASLPSLSHTKVLAAGLNGVAVSNANWNSLYLHLIRESKLTAKNPDEVRRLILTNYIIGKKEEEGYRYLAPQGFSVQGVDSNGAAKGMFHIAKQMNWNLEVEFAWRQKEDAAFPGQIARIST